MAHSVTPFLMFARSAEEAMRFYVSLFPGSECAVFMPLGDYGFSLRFGWLSDRYGVSWQLNLHERPTR